MNILNQDNASKLINIYEIIYIFEYKDAIKTIMKQ